MTSTDTPIFRMVKTKRMKTEEQIRERMDLLLKSIKSHPTADDKTLRLSAALRELEWVVG